MIKDFLLVVDVGNSNIVFGIYKGDVLNGYFRLPAKENYTCDELGFDILDCFKSRNLNISDVKNVVVSCNNDRLTELIHSVIKGSFSLKPLFIGSDVPISINNQYINKEQTGHDRLLNALAAKKKYGYPCIIIDLGTATTIDIVDSAGDFIGGVIFPGLGLIGDSLSQRTSALPCVEFRKPGNPIGRSTEDCIVSGLYFGYSGALARILFEVKKELPVDPLIIATGGLAGSWLIDELLADLIDSHLTLDGIRLAFENINCV